VKVRWHTITYQKAIFPKDWAPALKCPVCKNSVTGYYIKNTRTMMGTQKRKFFIPCVHELRPEQEQQIVNDMMKRGI
jgi:hypothetical protein